MLPEEIVYTAVGDGLIKAKEEFLQKILVSDNIEQDYFMEDKPFARGNFGTVRRATHKLTGIKYAAKFLRRRRRATCWAKYIQHEIAVLMLSADCIQIVKLHAVYETRSEFVLVLEMASGGELQAILDEDGSLTEQKTRICVQQVLKALAYLHRRNIAHLDLKPQNILLNTNNLNDGLKLCDFGFSRTIAGANVYEIQGTPDYVAPETVQYEPLSLKTDIWSIGVLAYVLLTGFSPFGSDDKQETFLNITKCHLTFPDELFSDVSDDAIDFIQCTLRLKPSDRLDVSECLSHKWLKTDTTPQTDDNLPQTPTVRTALEDHGTNDETNQENKSRTLFHETVTTEDDKENLIKTSENGDKDSTTIISSAQIKNQHFQTPPSIVTNKIILEKSASISVFPDAPTTPKVCRTVSPYEYVNDADDLSSQVKVIVKKYQDIEHQQHVLTYQSCDIENDVAECLVCHQQKQGKTNRAPSTLDAIIC